MLLMCRVHKAVDLVRSRCCAALKLFLPHEVMLLKFGQWLWIKIEITRARNAYECYQGLQKACGKIALPYRMVIGWVNAFLADWNETANLQCTGRLTFS